MIRRRLCLLPVGMLLTACAMGLKPEGMPPRPDTVTGILFRAMPSDLSSAGDGLDTGALAQTVSKNLGGWGFPVNADPNAPHSYVMNAKVDDMRETGTPVGFSFVLGNPDPRSLEFQKAQTVSVTCSIRGTERDHENAYLKETFMADELRKKSGKDLFDAYANHIGTACFNLLSELKIHRSKGDPKRDAAESAAGPAWFPEVRIEVRDKPVVPAGAAVPTATTGAVKTSSAPPAPASPQTSAASAMTATDQAPALQTEVKEGETRKQMIIHNQGHPIILEFGYDRK